MAVHIDKVTMKKIGLFLYSLVLFSLGVIALRHDIMRASFTPFTVFIAVNIIPTSFFLLYITFFPQVRNHLIFGTQEAINRSDSRASRSIGFTPALSAKKKRLQRQATLQNLNENRVARAKPTEEIEVQTHQTTQTQTRSNGAIELNLKFLPVPGSVSEQRSSDDSWHSHETEMQNMSHYQLECNTATASPSLSVKARIGGDFPPSEE